MSPPADGSSSKPVESGNGPIHALAFASAAAVATTLGLVQRTAADPHAPWVEPGRLVLAGIVGLIAVNIVAFTLNMLAGLPRIWGSRHAATEAEIEAIATPVIEGRINSASRLGAATGIAVALAVGVLAGGVVSLIVRQFAW
jgi:hypothetical protein